MAVRAHAHPYRWYCHNYLPIFEFGHHHDRAKGLLFGDKHVVLHLSEQSRLHEETWIKMAMTIINWC